MTEQKINGNLSYILDSSLKSRTIPKICYDIKVIKCGKYKQYFKKNYKTIRQLDGWEIEKNKNNNKLNEILNCSIDENELFNKSTEIKKEISNKEIDVKNLQRSKNNMCRLIYANEEKFKSFITLTFEEDMRDIEKANIEFQKFIRKIKRVYHKFCYVAVPEFQKNERIHYHLITNIDYNDILVINENIALKKLKNTLGNKFNIDDFREENIKLKKNEKINDRDVVLRLQDGEYHNTKKTFNHKTKSYKIFKTIKFWNNGFSNVMKLNLICGNNIAGYMAKYMLKDLDNRLWGKKRYFFSQNLEKPVISYLDSSNEIDMFIFNLELENCEIKYQKNYKDKFENDIEFYEIKSDDGFISYLKK